MVLKAWVLLNVCEEVAESISEWVPVPPPSFKFNAAKTFPVQLVPPRDSLNETEIESNVPASLGV